MIFFLTILKIIGIILLVLAAVIAMALFLPVSYEFYGDIDAGSYRFRIHWLFHLIRFRFQYREKAEAVLRILFFRIDFTDPEAKKKREDRRKKRGNKRQLRRQRKRNRKKEKQKKGYQRKREKNRGKIQLEETDFADSKKTALEEPTPKAAEGETLVHVAVAAEETAEDAGIHIPEGIKNTLRIIRSLYESKIFGILLPKLQVFLIRIRPRKLQGHLEFGFSDPAVTGQVLGAAAMIPFLFQTELQIFPDFETEKMYLSGNVFLKGRIYGIHVIIFVIQIFRDKNIRKLIGNIRGKE